MKEKLRSWNKQIFRIMFFKKKRLLARLNGNQKRLCYDDNSYIMNLESELSSELNLDLEQEECIWKQKPQCNWLQNRDRNTRIFHASTLIRRMNHVELLRIGNGDWISDKEALKGLVVDYFEKLYSNDDCVYRNCNIPNLFSQLEMNILDKGILKIWRLRRLYFPLDLEGSWGGYPAAFFHRLWNILGSNVCNMVKDSIVKGHILERLSDNYFCKTKGSLLSIHGNFRPISLCNTLYKVISKVIVQRIRPIIKKLICPNQVSFIVGRQIIDHVVVTQEMLHQFKKSQSMKCMIMWKLTWKRLIIS